MQTMKETKINRVFVAFPGMGKTTYAQHHSNVVDLDFGNFRSAMGMKPMDKNVATILIPFSKLIKYYYQDGFDVLINEPALIPLIVQFVPKERVLMVLPVNETKHVKRIWERANDTSNRHNKAFASEMEANIVKWVRDWKMLAIQYGILFDYVTNFEEVM